MKQETIIIVGGTAMILGAFIFFGKTKKPGKGSDFVPVPYDPPGVEALLGSGDHYSYRDVFITVAKPSLISSVYRWVMRGAPDLAVAPLAVSSMDFASEELALSDAMKARDVQLGGG